MAFIGIFIRNEGNGFLTSFYLNKPSIGLFTQFNSFTQMSYKIGLIRCLMQRVFKICGSYIIFRNELGKIKTLLQKSMYPRRAIDCQNKTFLEKQFAIVSSTPSEKRKTLHYSLPYIGCFPHVRKKKLRHICKRSCEDIEINIAVWPLKLGSFFICKDTLPKSL